MPKQDLLYKDWERRTVITPWRLGKGYQRVERVLLHKDAKQVLLHKDAKQVLLHKDAQQVPLHKDAQQVPHHKDALNISYLPLSNELKEFSYHHVI